MTLFFENNDGKRMGINTELMEFCTNFTEEARQCMPISQIYAMVSNIEEILSEIVGAGFTYADEWTREYVLSA